jgi:hypothetical protein
MKLIKKTKLYFTSSVVLLAMAGMVLYFSGVIPAFGVGTTNPTPVINPNETNTFTSTTTFTNAVSGASDFLFGNGADNASTTAGDITLDRDYFFTDYTVATGTTVTTNGYKIFVNGTLTVGGIIDYSASDGGDGGDGCDHTGVGGCSNVSPEGDAGTAGSGTTAGTLPASASGTAGGTGRNSGLNGGNASNSGTDYTTACVSLSWRAGRKRWYWRLYIMFISWWL